MFIYSQNTVVEECNQVNGNEKGEGKQKLLQTIVLHVK